MNCVRVDPLFYFHTYLPDAFSCLFSFSGCYREFHKLSACFLTAAASFLSNLFALAESANRVTELRSEHESHVSHLQSEHESQISGLRGDLQASRVALQEAQARSEQLRRELDSANKKIIDLVAKVSLCGGPGVAR